MSVHTNLPESVKALALSEAQAFASAVEGIKTVVVATIDGFDIASAVSDGSDPARVAAMASSISAISGVVSQETALGRNKSVIIDTDAGFAVVHSVHRPDVDLVIIVIASAAAILGQVAYRSTQFARTLVDA